MLDTYVPSPAERLPRDSVKVMVMQELLGSIVTLGVLGGVFALYNYFSWPEWVAWVLLGLAVLMVLLTIPSLITPFFKYKNTRYGVTEEFLLIKTGALKQTEQVIPMAKIQAVSTEQGMMMRKYKMMSISVQTTGSNHAMPFLYEKEAKSLRNKIAHYAKIEEVEAE